MIHSEAIIDALEALGREGTIKEINNWINERYLNKWKDASTALADMVPEYLGGNNPM
jgi:hypothetical protein